MKKKIPGAVKFFLISFLLFVLFSLSVLLFEPFPDSETVAYLCVILFLASAFFAALAIREIIRKFRSRIEKKHKSPSQITYSKILVPGENTDNSSAEKYTYNRKTVFRYNDKAEALSWGLVIFMLVLFFPLGVYWMIIKTVNEKASYHLNGVTLNIIGAIYMLISFLVSMIFVREDAEVIKVILLPFAIIFAVGAAFVVYGFVLRAKGNKLDKYMNIITVEKITQTDRIAAMTNDSYSKTVKTIGILINEGFLENSYIYYRDREVIVPGISKKTAFKCPSCAGTTVLYSNEDRICEYCGGKI